MPQNCQRLAEWYSKGMEVQINVAACGGELVSPGVYTDDKAPYNWYNVRIPKHAKSNPVDNDYDLKYPLDQYVSEIGLTGWRWSDRRSVRFGWDFDSIAGHAAGVGVSDRELDEIKQRAFEIPEMLVLRSAGGKGIHLYLECDPENLPQTATHTEHAALAMAALKDISQRVNFDFQASMDVGGGNLWVWSKRVTPENQGLTVLKDNIDPVTKTPAYYTPPENWRDYLDVAAHKRSRPRIQGIDNADQEQIDQQNAANKKIELELEHETLIKDLQGLSTPFTTVWVPEHGLLQTHTAALKQVAQQKTYVQGIFDTISEGRDPSTPNCFCYPQPGGGWKIVRFGQGTTEHKLWKQDKKGWTYCFYNMISPLPEVADFFRGVEDEKGGFVFAGLSTAIEAAKAMGGEISIPDELDGREITFRTHKDGRLVVEVVKLKSDTSLQLDGWLKKRNNWYKIFDFQVAPSGSQKVNIEELDTIIRTLVTPQYQTAGWVVKHNSTRWIMTKKDDARTRLQSSVFATSTDLSMAFALEYAWVLVNLPFQGEYPGNRQWNFYGAKFSYQPADIDLSETPAHPHWDLVLEHCGQDLTPYLQDLTWAKKNNITTGREYLLVWIACMFRDPFQALPYLFLWGQQNSGKSILHEALELLMTTGVVKADTALTSKADFNGELASAILCVVEEKNIAQSPSAYNKLKEWVTALQLSIHAKYQQVYTQPNTTHWIQCANDQENCPIFPGDTRIISMYVAPLALEIPKMQLLEHLREEAPQFMTTIQRLTLPDIEGRLRLPVITTSSKQQMERTHTGSLMEFIDENCVYAPGYKIGFQKFYTRLTKTFTSTEKATWSKRKVITVLLETFPIGKDQAKKQCIGNIAWKSGTNKGPTDKIYTKVGNDLQLVSKGD